ncbi:C40 family peptidase [Peptostreptococcus anaerobius]|uniref:C40 family peptidase n=1 Tax=Peptostreptococcus anaerobius TaxID=1261 RepID=UPI003218F4ED
MATYENKDIELIVHIRGGKFYKLSSVLSSVVWSGDIKSPSRTLEFSFLQAVNDAKVQQLGIVEGSTCCFYVGGKEIFRGTIIDIDKSNSNNEISMTAHDIGFLLAKDQVNYNFVNKTACDIAKEVFKGKDKQPPLKWGKIAPAGTKITKMFIGATRYDTIMSVYTAHSKADKDHKKYMVEVDLDKFNIIEKGVTKLKIMFEEEQNLEVATYKVSMENIVSRVVVVDEKGNKIKESLNAELRKLYQYISKVIEQKKDKAITDEEIKAEFKKPERSCSLSGYGDISCKCGYKVQVKDSFTGLIGEFYIDKDKHTWSGGKYTVDLELNFDNIMDEKNAGKDETKETTSDGAGGSSTKDWGHGVTAEMLNKVLKGELAGQAATIIKWCNAFKINPLYFVIQAKIECGQNIDSYNARVRHNYGGITKDPEFPNMGKYAKYPSKEKGIERMCRLISVKYLNEWNIRDVDRIIAKWAPASDGNDVQGYIRQMKNTYKQVTGKTWDNSMLGTGVKSVEEAYRNLNSGGASGVSGTLTPKQEAILRTAESMVGKGRYTWGGKTIYASDCSGFVMCCHRAAGISIGGSTAAQLHDGKKIPSLAQALPGDIIITQSSASGSGRHVVLYIGNGMQIHNGGPGGAPITKTKLRLGRWHEIRRCW